ncbi:MAG: DUF2974 domain-containing protein [Clostridia bacterium]|nr:DUF2974 domain-containing protein [Clostridia bacterium]
MSNILDYIDWRGDLTFDASPFCPVDNLVFSKLIYTDLEGAVPDGFSTSVSLADAFERYTALGRGARGGAGDPFPLFERAAKSARFRDVRVCGYEKTFDGQRTVQFAAASFLFEGGIYLAFEGTDDSFVGWREDAELAFMDVTEGQREAADYARRASDSLDGAFYLGGHSKGGNLAVYAAAFGLAPERVRTVFSNDGPGLNAVLAGSVEYAAVRRKIEKYIPESSIVGILLPDGSDRTVVKSDGRGLGQHNVYTWQVRGPFFETADERSPSSVFTDEAVQKWMISMPPEKRKIALDALFDALESSGCTTFGELGENKREGYNAVLRAVMSTDPDARRQILEGLKNAAKSGGEVIWDNVKRRFESSGAIRKVIGKHPAKTGGKPNDGSI